MWDNLIWVTLQLQLGYIPKGGGGVYFKWRGWSKDFFSLWASSAGCSGSRAGKGRSRTGKGRRACNYLSRINICTKKVDVRYWLVEMILVMTSLPWHMFFDDSLLSSLFPLCADWQKSDSSVDGEPQGSGGGIQIPETQLQALLPFPASWRGAMGELARELDFFG